MTGCYLSIKQQYGRNVNESWMLLRRRRLWASKPKLNALINHPVQGLCADIIKLAGLKLTRTLMDYLPILPESLAVQLQFGQSNRASIGYRLYLITLGGRCDGKRLESSAMVIRNPGATNRHPGCRNHPDRSGAFQEFLAGVE